MIVSVFRVQAISPDAAREICWVWSEFREVGVEPGWLRCTCLFSISDPRDIFIHEHWGNLAAWNAWVQSPAYHALQERIGPLMDQPFTIELYRD